MPIYSYSNIAKEFKHIDFIHIQQACRQSSKNFDRIALTVFNNRYKRYLFSYRSRHEFSIYFKF